MTLIAIILADIVDVDMSLLDLTRIAHFFAFLLDNKNYLSSSGSQKNDIPFETGS